MVETSRYQTKVFIIFNFKIKVEPFFNRFYRLGFKISIIIDLILFTLVGLFSKENFYFWILFSFQRAVFSCNSKAWPRSILNLPWFWRWRPQFFVFKWLIVTLHSIGFSWICRPINHNITVNSFLQKQFAHFLWFFKYVSLLWTFTIYLIELVIFMSIVVMSSCLKLNSIFAHVLYNF